MGDQRPVHLEVNCSTGAVTRVPLTDDEWNRHKIDETEAVETEKARLAADEQLRAAVAAHADPVVRELAKRLGLADG